MTRKTIRVCVILAAALGAVGAVGLMMGVRNNPYLNPSPYYPAIRANAGPLISALGSFARDNGKPPETLAELVPKYLSQVPQTGYPPQPQFEYRVQKESHLGMGWYLTVYTDRYLGIEPDLILYDSSYDRWAVDE